MSYKLRKRMTNVKNMEKSLLAYVYNKHVCNKPQIADNHNQENSKTAN